MNRPQRMAHYIGAHDERGVASRRVGKSERLGARVYNVVKSLPGGKSAFGGISRAQVMMKTWPSAKTAMCRFYGLREGVHFGGGTPPKWVPKPINDPDKKADTIWFANGHIQQIISTAQVGSGNSYTFSHISWDECRFTKKEKMYSEVVPANSGETHPFAHPGFSRANPYYTGTCFVSDAALTMKQSWLEQEEEKLNDHPLTGPLVKMTYGEIQQELEQFARTVIRWNDMLYWAKKERRNVHIVSAERKAEIEALATAVANREGQFKIIPRQYGVDTRGTIERLVSYHLIDQDTAELLYDHKYLATPEDHELLMSVSIPGTDYQKRIQLLRSWAFYCWRASTLDNADIVGFDYIAQMFRDLAPGIFSVSILNEKRTKANDGFYTNLNIEAIHGYIPEDSDIIDKTRKIAKSEYVRGGTKYTEEYETPDFDRLAAVDDCTQDSDVMDGLPLHIAFDYGLNFNCIVTGQQYKRDGVEALCILSSMYVQYERKLQALLDDWNHYYAPHRQKNRTVYYYYDATSKFRPYAIEGQSDFKDTIISTLTRFGWEVVGTDLGHPMQHTEKYKHINDALGGFTFPAIRINMLHNEALICAMEMAEIKMSYSGTSKVIKKDKSGEKRRETDENPMATRTDITDAFDTLFVGVKYFRSRMGTVFMPNGT